MIKRIFSATLLAIIATLLVVSPILAFTYSADYTIKETSINSYTMLPVTSNTTNNQWMADNGFFNTTANDTRVETLGGSVLPWMVVDNMTLTATAINANSQLNYLFTTGNDEATAMDIIAGYGGYATTPDSADMELGDNFTSTQKVYVNTDNGTDRNLIYKDKAFKTFVSSTVSGNITSSIYNASAPTSDATARPNAAGDATALSVSAGTNWSTQQDNNDGTYVYKPGAGNGIDYYAVDSTTVLAAVTSEKWIVKVEVYTRAKRPVAAGVNWMKGGLRLDGTTVWSVAMHNGGVGGTSYYETIARPSGGDWSVGDFANLQVGVQIQSDGGAGLVYCMESGFRVTFNDGTSVSATGIASGVHTVTTGIVRR